MENCTSQHVAAWRETCKAEEMIRKRHPAHKYTPVVDTSQDINYFGTKREKDTTNLYDRVHEVTDGYCNKIHRDDRMASRNLRIREEEKMRAFPLLTSSLYGSHTPLEEPSHKHSRVGIIRRDFYRKGGINLDSKEEVEAK